MDWIEPTTAAAVEERPSPVTAGFGPEPLKLRSSQPLPDLSGLAWMGDDLLLAVHDAKNPVELDRPRISLLSPPASLDGVLWQPLEVSFPGEKSSDLESVASRTRRDC